MKYTLNDFTRGLFENPKQSPDPIMARRRNAFMAITLTAFTASIPLLGLAAWSLVTAFTGPNKLRGTFDTMLKTSTEYGVTPNAESKELLAFHLDRLQNPKVKPAGKFEISDEPSLTISQSPQKDGKPRTAYIISNKTAHSYTFTSELGSRYTLQLDTQQNAFVLEYNPWSAGMVSCLNIQNGKKVLRAGIEIASFKTSPFSDPKPVGLILHLDQAALNKAYSNVAPKGIPPIIIGEKQTPEARKILEAASRIKVSLKTVDGKVVSIISPIGQPNGPSQKPKGPGAAPHHQ